jgi:hypothetical protein
LIEVCHANLKLPMLLFEICFSVEYREFDRSPPVVSQFAPGKTARSADVGAAARSDCVGPALATIAVMPTAAINPAASPPAPHFRTIAPP